MTPTHADPELMRIFDFTADDLEANRAGRMSERQAKSLKNESEAENVMVSCALQMAILCIGIFVFASVSTSGRMILVTIPILVAAAIVFLNHRDKHNSNKKAVQTQRAGRVESTITLRVQNVFDQRYSAYQIIVDGKIFQIEKSLYFALDNFIHKLSNQPTFRIYFAPETSRILSVEMV